MKKRIIPIISVVFLTVVIGVISTPKVIAKPDKAKALSESEKQLKAISYNRYASILLREAIVSNDKSKYKEAIKKCEEALKLDPNYVYSYITLGLIYSSMEQYDKSDSFFDKAAALDPKLPELELANVSTETAALLSKVAKDLNIPKLIGDLKKVNANLRKMSPEERQAHEEKMKKISSEILIRLKGVKEGIEEEELMHEGEAFLEEGKYDKAIETFMEAINANPNNASAYYWLGIAYSEKEDYNKMEDYSKANEAWEKAVSIDPEYTSQVSERKKSNQEHRSMTPEEKRAYQKWLKAYKAEQTLPAEERDRLEKARKAEEYYNDGFMALLDARHKGNKNKYKEAIKNFKKALELKPDYEEARLEIGNTFYDQKLYNQAMEEYKKVIAKNPKSIKARLELKSCYIKLKKFEEAKKECNIILELDPDNTEAKECLKNLQPNKSQQK